MIFSNKELITFLRYLFLENVASEKITLKRATFESTIRMGQSLELHVPYSNLFQLCSRTSLDQYFLRISGLWSSLGL